MRTAYVLLKKIKKIYVNDKKNVFEGKEYFLNDSSINSFEEKINSDIEKSLNSGAWVEVRAVLVELGRGYFPELEKQIISRIKRALGVMSVSREKDITLSLATCFLMQPEGLELRKNLIRSHRISVKEVLSEPQCFRYARDTFEKQLSKWAPSNLYFFQDRKIGYKNTNIIIFVLKKKQFIFVKRHKIVLYICVM